MKPAIAVAAAMSCLAATPAPAAAPAPAPLLPMTKWQVDYGVNACRLLRTFGDAAHPTTFELSRSDPDPAVAPTFSLASPVLSPKASAGITIEAEGNRWQAMAGMVTRIPGEPTPILFVSGAKPLMELLTENIAAARATTATFREGSSGVTLELGMMNDPIHALDACMDDLVRSWGYDPDVQKSLSSRPVPSTPANQWINESDYPAAMLRDSATGGVQVHLDVSDTGEIAGCHVVQSGGDARFEQTTCDTLRRNGHFQPAKDSMGKAVASPYVLTVIWTIAPTRSPE